MTLLPCREDRTRPGRPRWSGWDAGCGLVIVILTAIPFLQVARFDFVALDDGQYVTNSELVQSGLDPVALWIALTEFPADNWHPLMWWSLMLDWQLFGLDPAAFHLVNLGWHLAATAMLFVALRELTGDRWRSAAAAALFGVHPLHVESVAWVSERKDVLSGFCWMVGLWAYGRMAHTGSRHWHRVVTAALAAGLMAKPIVVTLPCVFLLLDYWPLGRMLDPETGRPTLERVRRLATEKLFWFALCGAGCGLAMLAQKTAREGQGDWPLTLRLANATVSYVRYIGMTLWPVRLSIPYAYNVPDATAVASAAAVLLAITGLAVWRARRSPAFIVGWCWYLGTLVPVIGLMQMGKQPFADRYMYLPLVGLSIAALWGIPAPHTRRTAAAYAVVATGLLAALMVRTFQQTSVWRDTRTLYGHALAVDPTHEDANFLLGWQALADGDVDIGLKRLHTGVEWDRRRTEARRNYAGHGLSPSTVQLDRKWASVFYMLGQAQARHSGPASAVEDFRAAVQLDPRHDEARWALCTALADSGDFPAALDALSGFLQRRPDDLAARQLRDSIIERQHGDRPAPQSPEL